MSHSNTPDGVGDGGFDDSIDENKEFGTKAYPVESNIATTLMRRCEKPLSPAGLKSRYLKGIDE